MKKKLAYQVNDLAGYEGNSVVVFHQHGLAARRIGAERLDSEFDYVSCHRAPQFDEFADLGYVPQKNLLADGWWSNCPACDTMCHEENLLVGECVYCDWRCLISDWWMWRKIKTRRFFKNLLGIKTA